MAKRFLNKSIAIDLETSALTIRTRKRAKLERKERIDSLGLAAKPQTKPRKVYREMNAKAIEREL
jgi:FixJ family two-component response regulator